MIGRWKCRLDKIYVKQYIFSNKASGYGPDYIRIIFKGGVFRYKVCNLNYGDLKFEELISILKKKKVLKEKIYWRFY